MPQSALRHVMVDACLPLAKIAPTLVRLAGEPAPVEGVFPMSKTLAIEIRIAREDQALDRGIMDLGMLSPYSCPECHGALVQIQDGDFLRFRCHTGHAYSPSTLLMEVTESLENSLWSTLRVIQERVLLLRHLAQHARERQDVWLAEVAEHKARDAEQSSELIREFLKRQETLSEDQLRHAAG
jgi:two-component system chemotaxis response regulator CheB